MILPLSPEETSAIEGNLNAYVSHLFLFTYIRLTATVSSIHLKSIALICLIQNAQSAWAVEYTNCFSVEGYDPTQRVSCIWD